MTLGVSAERAWNTWDPAFPGAMVHLPTGFVVRISAFSASERRATDFPYGADVRLGPHLADGSYVEVELPHAGSRLRLRFAKPEPSTVIGELEVLETAEWGLRFWYWLEVGSEPGLDTSPGALVVTLRSPPGAARYVDPPVAVATRPGSVLAFGPALRPVGAHLYEDRADARQEFERHGYYARPPERDRGSWAVFRFNAATPSVVFAATVAADEEGAIAGLRAGLDGAAATLAGCGARAEAESPRRAAIRDVLAWNTVWDPVNVRGYTAATRSWVNDRFGGWIVWQQDAFYHALMAAHLDDRETADANLDAALSCATEAGNLAALRSARTDWVDRAHPPIGAHVTWEHHRRFGARAALDRAYPALRRAFDWWFEARDGNGNGLLEYGSSPVGDGHFVHTKLAAMDESAMDNSPVHDEATFDPSTHTLDCEDVGLNSLLVLEGEGLARIAEELGLLEESAALRERTLALAARVQGGLWDPDRRVFANRLWSGRFVRSLAPTSFYPMAAGIATPEQAEALVREHLVDPAEFWGEFPVAGTSHGDPAAEDNVYWRGRVWPPMNYLVHLGLVRYGYDAEAAELASGGAAMFDRGWALRRAYENYHQRTGEGGDSVDSDPFYTWSALLALLAEIAEPGGP